MNSGKMVASACSPVVPSTSAIGQLWPLGLRQIRVLGGLWAERRRVNRTVTIPHGAAQLKAAGNVTNFRLAAGLESGPYLGGTDDAGTPFPFLDSDVYKWLEAVGWELGQEWDASLASLADELIELIGRAQRADGYLNTFFQAAQPGREFRDLQWGHELYTAGHLIQAAVAWKRAVGDDRLLSIAQRAVARINAELGPGRRELIDGHPEIEMALVELYRITGEAEHLELASTLIERRGRGLLGEGRFGAQYWQDHEPVRTARAPAGHAVRQMYLDCGVVDVAVETGDRDLLEAVIRRWEDMLATRTYLTGGIGSRHRDEAFGDPYELPPDRAYAETCAAIGSVMLAWRLLLATGESRFADLIERTALNAVLAGLSLDGRHFFYSNPLQWRSTASASNSGVARGRRATWFSCACCPPNLMRFLATLPDLLATTDGRGVQLHQYATSSLEVQIPAGRVALSVESEYPWDGTVTIRVLGAPPAAWPLRLRVPSWCRTAAVAINGDQPKSDLGGDVMAERQWEVGDELVLTLAMPARVTLPDPRIDAIRGTVAYERGPIVYAVETADLPPGVEVEALEVDPSQQAELGSDAALPGLPVLVLSGAARRADASATWPYVDLAGPFVTPTREPIRFTAVPYFAWANRRSGGMRVWLPLELPRPDSVSKPSGRS